MKLQNLNQAQLAAVQTPMGATMVLAGAGTGKTRVLTNRILYLVEECGVHPSEILAITFTNKAANEMKKRLYEFECHAEYMHISTIHSFCAFVLRREAERIGRSRSFSIYDEEEKKSVLKKLVRESCDDSSSGIVDKIADGISNIKNNAPEAMVSLAQNADVCVQSELDSMSKATELGEGGVIKIIEEYNARLKGNNAVDFDDLLYFVHTLFKNYPEVLAQYRERYRHVLIDEFQDTNRVQYEIFRMLAGDGDIFVVGDDDQSIYSWRGADAYNLMKFSKDYPNCSVYKLQQNYRSTQAILDVANDIIAQNDNRFEKTHSWEFRRLTRGLIPACMEMLGQWQAEFDTPPDGLEEEHGAIIRAFMRYDALGLEGGALFAEGRLIGFTIGEVISSDTFDVHFEKAFASIPGAYPMVCREFTRQLLADHPQLVYLNREDDMGQDNLREAKLEYAPELLLAKYTAVEARHA